jgi:hypothetical protein
LWTLHNGSVQPPNGARHFQMKRPHEFFEKTLHTCRLPTKLNVHKSLPRQVEPEG